MNTSPATGFLRGTSHVWGSEAWRWHPQLGRWSAARYGLPKVAVYGRIDTEDHRPHERYDFWRETALTDFDADRQEKSSPVPFEAVGWGVMASTGFFHASRSSAISGRRRAVQSALDGIDDISIGLVLSGERRHREGEEASSASAGSFYSFDARRDSRAALTAHSGTHLVLRRKTLEAVFGAQLPSSATLARMLTASRMGPFLATQMQMFAASMHDLDGTERSGLLQTTIGIANLALRQIAGSPGQLEEQAREDLFTAAMRLIEVHITNRNLGPDMLAGMLQCSRATLYRSFAERELAVSGVIRDTRLSRARELLQTTPPKVTIAEIALSCGYDDASHFRRVFRSHFGFSPTEMRA